MSALPADTQIEGNVWCDYCQQSLAAARGAAHLASKKHADNVEKLAAAKKKKTPSKKAPARDDDDDSDFSDEEEKRPAKQSGKGRAAAEKTAEKAPAGKASTKKAPRSGIIADRPSHGLMEDPAKPGNFYCGICKVSLSPSKAAGHLETARHQANKDKAVTAAMRDLSVTDDD
jgi:hypothetical protein